LPWGYTLSKKLAETVQYYSQHQLEKIVEVGDRLRITSDMGVGDTMIREYHHQGVVWRGIGAMLLTIFWMPIVLYGWINSLPAIILTTILSHRKANRLTKIALTKLTTGLLIFPVIYILQIIIFRNLFEAGYTVPYAISLPLTGFFTLFFRDKFKAYKRDIYQTYVHFTKRSLIFILKEERLKLFRYLNKMREEYTAIMK